jgi:RecA-family ATPase
VRCLADILPEPIDWLWKSWIARSCLNLLDGDPDLGKSTITIDFAARVSRGWPMPSLPGGEQVCEPADVLLLSAEDSAAQTIRPRLDAAGADVSRIHLFEAVKQGEDERPPILPFDLDLVAETIRARRIALVVVDPLMAYLDSNINAHHDQDVRRAMHRLKILAEQTGAAVLVVRHLNKLAGGPALYRGGGSIGIIGAARSAMVVGRDPGDDKRRVLASNKCNLGPAPRSLYYSLEPKGDVARIGWGKECDLRAADILEHPTARRQSRGEQCAEAVQQLLTSGPKRVEDLEGALMAMGYGQNAIKDGRRLARVKVERAGFGKEGAWMAKLPDEPAAEEF